MARPRRQETSLGSASMAALERALAKRRRVAERLEARRDRLAKRLAEIEAALQLVHGAPGAERQPAEQAPVRTGRVRRRRKGAGGGLSLLDAIGEVLKRAKEPLRASQVMEQVEAAGYRSRAKNFTHLVSKALGRHPQAARAGRGLYVYKP